MTEIIPTPTARIADAAAELARNCRTEAAYMHSGGTASDLANQKHLMATADVFNRFAADCRRDGITEAAETIRIIVLGLPAHLNMRPILARFNYWLAEQCGPNL